MSISGGYFRELVSARSSTFIATGDMIIAEIEHIGHIGLVEFKTKYSLPNLLDSRLFIEEGTEFLRLGGRVSEANVPYDATFVYWKKRTET